ncbi:MAG: hypothetical protein E7Z64_05155 [Thermoplasmata archaeon]|nr:hypothetical protein [Thermoplasmata archaeon]
MSSIVYLKNPKSNTVYAYLNESVWDPEKKKTVYKRRCIGHVDPETGEIVPNRKARFRESPTVKSRYLCAVFDKVSEDLKLTETMKMAFPDDWKKMLSVVYYLVATRAELSFCKQWSENHKTPYNQILTSNVINDLLSSINSNGISLFFTLWKLRLQPEETFTSSIDFGGSKVDLSQYSRDFDMLENDFDNNLKLTIYFSTRNNIPICYQLSNLATGHEIGDYDVYPGSFSRLSSFMDETRGDAVDPSLIPYANSNITIRTYPENEFVRDLVLKSEPSMTNPANYRIILGTPLFLETYMQHVNGRRYYVHIFFDPNQAVNDLSAFISIINICKYEVEMDKMKPQHQDLYDRFLIIKEDEFGRKNVELNSEAIMHHDKFLGYNVLISNFTRNPATAIVPFLQKNTVSKMFSSIRNEYDNTALNLYTQTNYLSRIFLQFLSLILRIGVLNVMNSKKLNTSMNYKEMVMELSSIKTVRTPGSKKGQDTFLSDKQMRILQAFDVEYRDE